MVSIFKISHGHYQSLNLQKEDENNMNFRSDINVTTKADYKILECTHKLSTNSFLQESQDIIHIRVLKIGRHQVFTSMQSSQRTAMIKGSAECQGTYPLEKTCATSSLRFLTD